MSDEAGVVAGKEAIRAEKERTVGLEHVVSQRRAILHGAKPDVVVLAPEGLREVAVRHRLVAGGPATVEAGPPRDGRYTAGGVLAVDVAGAAVSQGEFGRDDLSDVRDLGIGENTHPLGHGEYPAEGSGGLKLHSDCRGQEIT